MCKAAISELKVRYTYRLRLSNTSERKPLSEWDRCRFVWNYCVARSTELRAAGEPCGPALLDKELTALRSKKPWLKEGSSVAQQQTIRDFADSQLWPEKQLMELLAKPSGNLSGWL